MTTHSWIVSLWLLALAAQDALGATLNVTNYGAIGDCREVAVSVSSNSATITTTNTLTTADVGKVVQLFGAGHYATLSSTGIFGGNYHGTPTNHQDLVATILAVSSGTNAVLDRACGVTAAGLRMVYGSDNRLAFSNAIAAADSNDTISIPAGNYMLMPPSAVSTNFIQSNIFDSSPTLILTKGGLRFLGAGTNQTILTGNGAWQQKGIDEAYRGYLLLLSGPVTENGPLIFDGLQFDGAATRNHAPFTGWPAVPTDGSGWDLTHHAITCGVLTGEDFRYLSITNCLFRRWRGETIQGVSTGTGITDIGNCWFIDGNATVINLNNEHYFHECVVDDYQQVTECGQFTPASGVAIIRNNIITNIHGSAAMAFTGAATNVAHPGYRIESNTVSALAGIYACGAKNFTVRNNWFLGGGIWIGVAGQQGTDCNRNWVIANNWFSNAYYPVWIGGSGANRLEDCLVVSNTAVGIGAGGFFGVSESWTGAWGTNIAFRSNVGNESLFSVGVSGQYFLDDVSNQFPAYSNPDAAATNAVSYGRGARHTLASASTNAQWHLQSSNATQIPVGAVMLVTNTGFAARLFTSSDLSNPMAIPAGYSETFTWTNGLWATNVVPESRRIDWGRWTGIEGGIPVVTNVFTNMVSLDNTGATDVSVPLQAALNACPSNSVVLLPDGYFLITNTVAISQNGSVLRGSSTNSRIIERRPSLRSDGGIRIGSASDLGISAMWTNAGLALRGQTNLTLLTTAGMAIGNILAIEQINDPAVWYNASQDGGTGAQDYHNTTSLTNYMQMQFIQVESISSTNITFSPPLINTWTNALNCRLVRRGANNWPRLCGLENLTIIATNIGSSFQQNVRFGFADRCWVSNVVSLECDKYHIYSSPSFRCQVFASIVKSTSGGGSGGNYGIGWVFGSGFGRIENNISENTLTLLVLGEMAQGNVIGYNFEAHNYYSPTNWLQPFLSMHDCGTEGNLFEGNVGGVFGSDIAHGNSHTNTIYRNFFRCWQPYQIGTVGSGIQTNGTTSQNGSFIDNWNNYYSVVGNVFGGPWQNWWSVTNGPVGSVVISTTNVALKIGYTTSLPATFTNTAACSNTVTTMILAGNYFRNTTDIAPGVPASQAYSGTLPSSLYLSERPAWFGGRTWPPIGPEVSQSTSAAFNDRLLPAQDRYAGESTPEAPSAPGRAVQATQVTAGTFSFRP